MRKNKGYGLTELILTLSILSVVSLGIMRLVLNDIDKRQAMAFREHIGTLIEQLQKYQYHKVSMEGEDPSMPQVWPANLNSLMTDYPDQFWPTCSQADEQSGLCRRPDGLPWTTQPLGYAIDATTFEPTVKLTFPLSVITPKDAARWAAEIDRLPFTAVLPNGDRVITVQNPLISQVYKEFLTRDGNTKLTDSWDVGNQSILNAKAISVRTTNNTQLRIDSGVVAQFITESPSKIYKNSWSCPNGLNKNISVIKQMIMMPDDKTTYIGFNGVEYPYGNEHKDYYEVGIKYIVKYKSPSTPPEGKWAEMDSGLVLVQLLCTL